MSLTGGLRLLILALVATGVANAQFAPFQPLPHMPPVPEDNLQSPGKIELGKKLFFDPRLSGSGSTTCQTCHNLATGATHRKGVVPGDLGGTSTRDVPTLWNVGFNTVYFWDGRAISLEAAIAAHLLAKEAMAAPSNEALVSRFDAIDAYRAEFRRVFGTESISVDLISKSIAAFLRTLVTQDSTFDQYLRGDEAAISVQAKRGFEWFTDSGCASCHFWVNLAGPVPGLAFQMGEGFYELFPNYPDTPADSKYKFSDDLGRYHVSGIDADKRLFRVPTLRNIALTAPYFHNGAVSDLKEAVRVMAETQLQKTFTDAQLEDVVAFLNTLTGEFPVIAVPYVH